jgi:hypothetical protein
LFGAWRSVNCKFNTLSDWLCEDKAPKAKTVAIIQQCLINQVLSGKMEIHLGVHR